MDLKSCYFQIYPGCDHSTEVCRSKTTIVENLANYDQKDLENALKRKLAQSGDNETAGPSTSKPKWTHDDIDVAQGALEISDGKALILAQLIREKEQRRDAVEPNLAKHLVEKKQLLSDYYKTEKLEYQFKEKKEDEDNNIITKEVTKEVITTYCSDIFGLIRYICVLRDLNDDTVEKKVGIDSGKGRNKKGIWCK